jgi:hypothetical protein
VSTPEVLETFSPGLYNRLIQASLESNCWAGLAKALHEVTGKGVLIESARFKPLAASGVKAELRELSAARWLDRNGRPGEQLYLLRDFIYTVKLAEPSRTGWHLVGIIHGEEGVLGYLSLISEDDRGLASSLILLEKTLPLAVICWWRQQGQSEGPMRWPEQEQILKNGNEAGPRVEGNDFYWFCPLVLRLQTAAGAEPEAKNAILAHLKKILTSVYAQTDISLTHTVHGEEITVLLGSSTARPAKSFCLSLAARLIEKWEEKEIPAYLHIGIGQAGREPAQLKTFLAQAREAARLFNAHCEGNQVCHYEDLAVCHFLAGVNPPLLEDFLAKTIAPLLKNRRSRELRLLETLEAYFGCHGNLSRLAKKLFLSRSSVVYRLQLIEQILGVKLADPLTRLSLQLALLVFWRSRAENILEKGD